MTAVLSATDALRKDRHLSLDDSQFDYSSATTDWRAKYHEIVHILAHTREELEDFQATSRELEAEMEADLDRSTKLERELRDKIGKTEMERDEWKSKYMTLQTTHNTTTTSLQRELDKLRQEHQQTKTALRDLELGADDLERSKRVTSSSLVDMEAKYTKTLEEKILLEHELLEKASLEEEMQRIKDELRDAQDEIAILREQLTSASTASAASITSAEGKPPSKSSSSLQQFPNISIPSDEDLLHSSLPGELQLFDLSPVAESIPTPAAAAAATTTTTTVIDASTVVPTSTPKANPPTKTTGQSLLLHRAGFSSAKPSNLPSPISTMTRSTTLPTLSSPRTPMTRMPVPSTRTVSTSSASTATTKNKGVQMVSEMRARVRILEQKIHTRVPRLRMASITGRANAAVSPVNALGSSSSSSSGSLATTAKTSLDSIRRSVDSRRSNESDLRKDKARDAADTSGWVLIMEDSPSPVKIRERERQRERRRLSSPTPPSAYRSGPSNSGSTAPSPTFGKGPSTLTQAAANSGIRRPALHSSTPGVGLKKSTGPGGMNPPLGTQKRTSLGASTTRFSSDSSRNDRPSPIASLSRPGSSTPSSTASSRSSKYDEMKSLPHLPSQMSHHSNVTVRQAKLPSSGSSVLTKSRIGRPGGTGARKSSGADSGFVSGDSLEDSKVLRLKFGS
ncbi:hypothetical protein AN958_04920 [Leucoagaricus sp. SymC.cos]|nr:hypothetical protein AN958_04920 [Leucoagaricus sp. SymC.cos]